MNIFRKMRLFPLTAMRISAIFLAIMITITTVFSIKEMNSFGLESISTRQSYLLTVMIIDLCLVLLLTIIIFSRLRTLYKNRKTAGYIIRYRITILFGFLAALPAIFIVVLAGFYLHTTLQGWFNERISTAINESSEVAQAYLEEHQQTILIDAINLSQNLLTQLERSYSNSQPAFATTQTIRNNIANELNFTLSNQSIGRKITEAVLIDESGDVIFRSYQTLIFGRIDISESSFEKANQGQTVLLENNINNSRRVRALIKLPTPIDALLEKKSYLLVGRPVDAEVLRHLAKTKTAAAEYNILESQRVRTQNLLMFLYIIIALIFLLAALWFGMLFAGRITYPITALITASKRVSQGDLSAQVEVKETPDELSMLGNSFNFMIARLNNQQQKLITTNNILEERRQFIETILTGVSAGIISVDPKHKITLFNSQAEILLGIKENDALGKNIHELIPELSVVFNTNRSTEIIINLSDKTRILQAQLSQEYMNDTVAGYIVTFDDITDLQVAERKAAWSGVARRIAHEIKNPLTPIQLSAERLQRRYRKQIDENDDVFDLCLQTIIRQVNQIERLVKEFSSFARLPEPVLVETDINNMIKGIFELEKQRDDHIIFEISLPSDKFYAKIDEGLCTQALTNIIKNATEATKDNSLKAHVLISLSTQTQNEYFDIIVEDSGNGFPKQNRSTILEPYVTTKKEGTGLGLAIVQRILADHNGDLLLSDSKKLKGAKVILRFPKI